MLFFVYLFKVSGNENEFYQEAFWKSIVFYTHKSESIVIWIILLFMRQH